MPSLNEERLRKIATDAASTGGIDSKLGTPAGASVSADVAAVKADTAAIKAKTDGFADPARLDAAITSRATPAHVNTGPGVVAVNATANNYTAEVIGNKSDALEIDGGATRSLVAHAKGALSQLATTLAQIALVKAKTDNLPASPASQGDIQQGPQVPTGDSTANDWAREVIGNKGDAERQTVEATRSLMGYVKGILTRLNNRMPSGGIGPGIRSIQRGTVTITGGTSGSTTLATTLTDVNKCVVHYLGHAHNSAGEMTEGRAQPRFDTLTTTQITFVQSISTESRTTVVSYQIVEYY